MQTVEIPDKGIAEFPDDMTPDQIKGVIQSKFYASPTPAATPQSGEITPPVIKDSGYVGRGEFAPTAGAESAPLTSRENPREQAAQNAPLANAASVATELIQGIPQMALGVLKSGYEGLKVAAGGSEERVDALKNIITQGLQQGQQTAKDVQSPLGTKESFRGIAGVGMMAVPALQELLFARPIGIKPPPVQTEVAPGTAPSLTQTLFGKEQSPVTAVVNESLSGLESSFGKVEPVAPDLPTGTGETIHLADWRNGGFKELPSVYIRFGELPKGKSGKFLEGKQVGEEAGVSVVKAWQDPTTGKYVVPRIGTEDVEDISGINRKAYLVEGKSMKELGSDEEPLLQTGSGKIIKQISHDDIVSAEDPNLTYSGKELQEHEIPDWTKPETQSISNLRESSGPEILATTNKGPVVPIQPKGGAREEIQGAGGVSGLSRTSLSSEGAEPTTGVQPSRREIGIPQQSSPVSEAPVSTTATPLTQEISVSGNKTPVSQTTAVGTGEGPIFKTVYHGSQSETPNFEVRGIGNDIGIHFGTAEQADFRVGDNGTVKPYIIEIKNPLRLEDQGGWYGESAVKEINDKLGTKLSPSASVGTIRQAIQKAGYDGVVYKNKFEHDLENPNPPEDSYIVFDKNQIKPAPVPSATEATTAPLSTQTGESNAVQIESPSSVLQHPQETVSETGGGRGTLESGVQGQETPEARQGTEAGTPTAQDVVVPESDLPYTAEGGPISTKNAYTEAQREVRGLPEAEQAAKRGFGKVWDEAAVEAEKDPTIGRRLVDEINAKPRPISDTENAHILRREIEAQKEHGDAVDAVNSATTDSDLTAAKARLESARNDLQDVYDATKSAGTKSGQALAARQMLAKEDYSLAKMEARRRAANDGQPLNEQQLAETSELHAKIADLQSKLDAHEVAATFDREFTKLVDQSRKEAKASKAQGTRFTDFMDRKANEARSRIEERRGRLTTGFDPTAITDEAVIGASHIAKGLTKFADWSVKMAEEFGEQIRPFLKDIWEKARSFHDANAKEYGDKALARYKTYLEKQTEQIKGKLEAGDFTKAQRQKTQLDKEAFTMRANLQKLKNEFERGVAKEAYAKKSPAQKFWDHFVGVERAMKLSGPEVFGKLGVAAAVREVLAPIEAAGGYGVSKVFPKLAKGTRYEADTATVLRSELKAKAALFTDGMKDAWQNVKGEETGLDAIGKAKIRPDFWYNRIGQMHAAIKAPVKRAEFTRSLEKGMSVAIKNGEDINHPEVMTRLANEAVIDANRAIFQNKTVVSGFFSMLERQSPAAGRVARFLFPVVKIPVNLFKELVNLHVGAPVGAARIGAAYWKGIETLPVAQREAIIRQLTKGSIGGAGLLWGYYNSDKVRNFFDHVPTWFNHTPMAMILNEGSYLKKLEQGGEQAKEGKKELAYMAKTDIPFMYTIKDIGDALDTHNSHALLGWINNMTQSTVVPQISTQVAKQMDKPGTFPSNLGEKPTYRRAANPVEAVKLGIPGLRETVPVPESKKKTNVSRRR